MGCDYHSNCQDQEKTFEINMKIVLSISLILVSATSYVQSDGHGHHGHHGHHDHQDYRPYYAYERQSSGYDAPAPEPSYGAPAPAPSYGAPLPNPAMTLLPLAMTLLQLVTILLQQ